jgi:hypothetical protein
MNLEKDFTAFVEQHAPFQEVLAFVREHQAQNTWLIGSFLFRNLLALQAYTECIESKDYDFLLENPQLSPNLPSGWSTGTNRFGNQKITTPTTTIDIVSLADVDWIVSNNLEPTLENFLAGAPLTIQSLAYNVEIRRLYGDSGLHAIQTGKIAIHNLEAAEKCCARYGITVEDYMQQKTSFLKN